MLRPYRDHAGSHGYLALHHLATDERGLEKAANTPGTERMRPHFRDHLRIPTRHYVRAH
jgi:hypothetical protein